MLFDHDKDKLILILDLQSSVVRGTLVNFQNNSKPAILFSDIILIPYKPHARSGYLIKTAIKGVGDTLDNVTKYLHSNSRSLHNTGSKKIDGIAFVLSSPWTVSNAKTLSTKFNKETIITSDLIKNIIRGERDKLKTGKSTELRTIEEKVFDVKLNGYTVESWSGKKATDLEISFVVGVAGGLTIDRLIRSSEHVINKKNISFHSSLFLQHIGIQKMNPDILNYTLIHIHGELTDVAIIKNGSCTFFGSFPFGIQSIIRTISKETKIDEKSAESLLNLYVHSSLDHTHARKETIVIENMQNGWVGEFRKLLFKNTSSDNIPRHIIISAHSHEDFFINSFKIAYPSHITELLSIDRIAQHISLVNIEDRMRITSLYTIALDALYS